MFPFHTPRKTPEDIKWDIWPEMGKPIKSWKMVSVKIFNPKKSKALERFSREDFQSHLFSVDLVFFLIIHNRVHGMEGYKRTSLTHFSQSSISMPPENVRKPVFRGYRNGTLTKISLTFTVLSYRYAST